MEEEAVKALEKHQLIIGNNMHHIITQSTSLSNETEESLSTHAPTVPTTNPDSEEDQIMIQQMLSMGKFQFIFIQQNIYYFKHSLVLEMYNAFGDIKNDIYDRQRCLTIALEEKLLDMEMELLQLAELLSTFDVYSSLGMITNQYKLIKPQLVPEPILILKNGRHLLQELTVENFVPNDTYLSREENIALITGPNSSGKSIYLKQVGLIVYLAHIGCFVPCERAIIGLTDQIVTRISSEETIANPQSTFTIDLCQMSKILKYATRQSLCLIDEFGKGTSPTDGMALLAAVIKHFTQQQHQQHQQSRCIFVLHFTEILQSKILHYPCCTNDIQIATGQQQQKPDTLLASINCFRMETLKEVMITSNGDDADDGEGPPPDKTQMITTDTGQLIPLYKLKYGIEEDSEGIHCAQLMGIPQQVITRALMIKHQIQHKAAIHRHQMTFPNHVTTTLSPSQLHHHLSLSSDHDDGHHQQQEDHMSATSSTTTATSAIALLKTYRQAIELFLQHKHWLSSNNSNDDDEDEEDPFPALKAMIITSNK